MLLPCLKRITTTTTKKINLAIAPRKKKNLLEVQVMASFSSLYLGATISKDCLDLSKATEQVRPRSDLYG